MASDDTSQEERRTALKALIREAIKEEIDDREKTRTDKSKRPTSLWDDLFGTGNK